MVKPKTVLITDSTCDLPEHLFKDLAIEYVPIYLIWDGEQLRDQIDITSEEFYHRIKQSTTLPTSSQPTPDDFANVFQEAAEGGAEEIVVITISRKMSGTYESAQKAAEGFSVPIFLHDSATGGTGLALQVLAAARCRQQGGDAKAMIAAAQTAKNHLMFVFFVDSLEALHRGGRIGKATMLIGAALNLKPVLYANPRDGVVTSGKRTRTRQRALDQIVDEALSFLEDKKDIHVAVCHSGALADAEAVAEKLTSALGELEIFIKHISPVMGVHIGPDAVGISCSYGWE